MNSTIFPLRHCVIRATSTASISLRTLAISQREYRGNEGTSNEEPQFGTLSQRGRQKLRLVSSELAPDDPDGFDRIERHIGPRKNDLYYKYEITKFARRGPAGIKRALELFDQMKGVDRLTPTVHNFSPLIYGCARAGYTAKAFQLYEEMLRYLKKPTQSIVSCMINACAECPFPDYGHQRLEWLRRHLSNAYTYSLNRMHYNCLIKAYGKIRHMDRAYDMLQEMIDSGLVPDINTFNALLVGCVSDKQTGLAHAIRIFRRIKHYGLTPTFDTYNLLLRCVRDCQLGDSSVIDSVIGEMPAHHTIEMTKRRKLIKKGSKSHSNPVVQRWIPFKDMDTFRSKEKPVISSTFDHGKDYHNKSKQDGSGRDDASEEDRLMSLSKFELDTVNHHLEQNELPNFLFDSPTELLLRVKAINQDVMHVRYNRLLLVGGVEQFLARMTDDGVTPNAKIFDMILFCLPHNWHLENDLINLMKEKYSLKPDHTLYNQLIHRASVSLHMPPARRLQRCMSLLQEMQTDGLKPIMPTFEEIAGACSTLNQAQMIIRNMDELGFTISTKFMANLFKCPLAGHDFMYLIKLIGICRQRKIAPSAPLVEHLDAKRLMTRKLLLDLEQGRLLPKPEYVNHKFKRHYDLFVRVFTSWIRDTPVESNDEHPWAQFNVATTNKREGYEKFVRDMKARHRDYWDNQISSDEQAVSSA